jgi:hypothetical protein
MIKIYVFFDKHLNEENVIFVKVMGGFLVDWLDNSHRPTLLV